MIGKKLDEHFRAHFAEQSLSGETLERLTNVALTGRSAHRETLVYPRRRSAYALAACLGLALCGNFYFAWSARSAWSEVAALRDAAFTENNRPVKPAPQWVAMRTVVEGCPWAQKVAPVFAELEQKHGDDPRVLFFTYDMTNERTRRECEKLAAALGFDWMMPRCGRSGTINLANCREKEIVSKLNSVEQGPELEAALAVALTAERP